MTGNVSILLVEDNPCDELLTVHALKSCCACPDISIVHDGAEALEFLVLRAHHDAAPGLPDLILLDLHLPKLTGLDVLREVRNDPRTGALPVIVLTSSQDGQDVADCRQAGASGFMVKPLDREQFVNTVRQLGLDRLLADRSPSS